MLKELLGMFENRVERGNIGDYLIQKRAKLPLLINFICTILIVVMLCILAFYRVPVHSCWICKRQLTLTGYPTRCCDIEYNIVNNELVAKKN